MKRKLQIGQRVWYEVAESINGFGTIEEINHREQNGDVESRTPIYVFDESKNKYYELWGSDIFEIDEALSFEKSMLVCRHNNFEYISWGYCFYCPQSFNKIRHKTEMICD